jgi:hypothetical protein
MLKHFGVTEAGIQCGNTSVTLRGRTVAGQFVMGQDAIPTSRCGANPARAIR